MVWIVENCIVNIYIHSTIVTPITASCQRTSERIVEISPHLVSVKINFMSAASAAETTASSRPRPLEP